MPKLPLRVDDPGTRRLAGARFPAVPVAGEGLVILRGRSLPFFLSSICRAYSLLRHRRANPPDRGARMFHNLGAQDARGMLGLN